MKKSSLLRSTLTGIAVGMGALLGSVAHAADLGGYEAVEDAPAPYLPRWTGFYVGGQIGYGEAFYDGVFDSNEGDPIDRAFAEDLDLSGVLGGVHVGYNLQKRNWVFGVEADINWTDWQDKARDAEPTSLDFVTGNVDFLATVRGRLGIAADRTLFYATAGAAFANAKYTAADPQSGTRGTLDFDDVGFVVGGGAEYALTDKLSLRVQGLYYIFDDKRDGSGLNDDSDAGDFARFEDAFNVTAGISYMF